MIRIFSDLHLEFGIDVLKKCVDMCSGKRTKYLILAGDITNFTKKEKILTRLSVDLKDYTDNIIYVLGNHEYYGTKNHKGALNAYRILCNKLGIHLLENSSLETEDFVFYGSTMWTEPTVEAFYRMNDQYSFESRSDVIDLHEESVFQLNKFLLEYNTKHQRCRDNGVVKPLVVITHHMPSFSLIDKKYQGYDSINTGFAGHLDEIIKNPVKYWIYAHTHSPNDTIMNGVRLICNPHGYKNENKIFKDCIL